MRKIFYASALFVAAIAVGCGNNQKPAADANGVTDSLEQMDTTGVAASVSESEVKENIASGINNLKTMIENKSASDFTAKLTEVQNNIQQLVQKDPEAAKQYVAQLQEFLKQIRVLEAHTLKYMDKHGIETVGVPTTEEIYEKSFT